MIDAAISRARAAAHLGAIVTDTFEHARQHAAQPWPRIAPRARWAAV